MADLPPGGQPPASPAPSGPAPAPAPVSAPPPGPVPVSAPAPGAVSAPPPAAVGYGPPGIPVIVGPQANLAAARKAPGRGRWAGLARGLILGGFITVIAGSAIAMLLILGRSLGIEALAIGAAAAILPVPVLVACFLWLDRYQPEPARYLLICFAWGAAVSTLISYLTNSTAAVLFERADLPEALTAVLVAPFIEELTKALGPILLLLLLRRREWSGITAAIVYCGMSAIGFAMVENILYLGGLGYASGAEEYGRATGTQNLILIFIVRVLLSGFAHPLFTAMAGIGLGIAARTSDRRIRVLAPVAGLLLAMMLHGTWNLVPSLVVATGQTLIMLYGYIGVMVPIFIGMIGLAIWLRSWEGRLTERTLPDYVRAGWLSPPEVAALGNLGRRHSARVWARRVAGAPGLKAMREFQFAATRLALLRDGVRRGLHDKPAARARAVEQEAALLEEISGYRKVYAGRDPQVPAALWDGDRYHITFPDGVRRTIDAPDQPVVPIPVVLAPPQPPPMPSYAGPGGYGPPGGYRTPGAYGPPPGGYPPPGWR